MDEKLNRVSLTTNSQSLYIFLGLRYGEFSGKLDIMWSMPMEYPVAKSTISISPQPSIRSKMSRQYMCWILHSPKIISSLYICIRVRIQQRNTCSESGVLSRKKAQDNRERRSESTGSVIYLRVQCRSQEKLQYYTHVLSASSIKPRLVWLTGHEVNVFLCTPYRKL